jgi:hypothetical protein
MTSTLVPALASGGLVGFSLGLVGGGGSIRATPLLLYVVGVTSPHVAIGTGALAVSINAYANLLAHARKGHVRWLCAAVFAAIGSLGALLGSSLGLVIDGTRLLLIFGALMVVVGLLMLRPRRVGRGGERPIHRRMCALTAATALATGGASGFFGIGGGFLIVPSLIFATGMPMIKRHRLLAARGRHLRVGDGPELRPQRPGRLGRRSAVHLGRRPGRHSRHAAGDAALDEQGYAEWHLRRAHPGGCGLCDLQEPAGLLAVGDGKKAAKVAI